MEKGRVADILAKPGRRTRIARLIEQEKGRLLNINGVGYESNKAIVEQRAAAGLGPWHTLPADRLPQGRLETPEAT